MLEQVISNKADWTRVAFGDVVRLSKLRAKDPEAEGYERVVGLEHIEPGDLRIRRWADIADGTTFTSVFKPGQVLFGKRRAYQRKVAVADFAGVCSGDIYVLEPSSDALMPELLPFICQTDAFFDHAVGTSAGSLSPRTNWKSLATFEFLLPPIQEQGRFVEALTATNSASDALYNLEQQNRQLLSSMLKDFFRHEVGKQSLILDNVLNRVIDYRGKPPPKSNSGVPLLTAKNIRDGYIDPEPREFIPVDEFDSWMRRGLPKTGDVLFTTEAPLGNVSRVPKYKFALGQRSITLRADADIIVPDYLYWLMRSPTTRREVFARATGTTALGIKQSLLRSIPISIAKMDDQVLASAALNEVEAQLSQIIERRSEFSALQKSLINRAAP